MNPLTSTMCPGALYTDNDGDDTDDDYAYAAAQLHCLGWPMANSANKLKYEKHEKKPRRFLLCSSSNLNLICTPCPNTARTTANNKTYTNNATMKCTGHIRENFKKVKKFNLYMYNP